MREASKVPVFGLHGYAIEGGGTQRKETQYRYIRGRRRLEDDALTRRRRENFISPTTGAYAYIIMPD